ncbi:MAG: divalent metal cation transporter [Patescibacteria group bacterium]
MKKKQFAEKFFGAPAVTLNKTLEITGDFAKSLGQKSGLNKAGQFWNNLGPGLTTGAADDDPSGIATYSQAGAKFGFSLAWLSAFTFPFMAVVQEMCARIGMVTGRGLAGNIRRHYSPWVLYLCAGSLFVANTFNIGANLGAMASAVKLLSPKIDFSWLVVSFAFLSLVLQIFSPYARYAKYLKWLALILVSYILSALLLNLNGLELIKHAFWPKFSFGKEQIFMVCAILGTTISPYLFFWQTSQEVEEEILAGKTTIKQRQAITTPAEIKKMRIDVWFGMFFSNLVMFFIIVACAATLYQNGITNISTAAEAALALKPFGGEYAFLLFTAGIIGTGLLAVPVLAGSASYALSEAFGFKQGLYRKLKQATAFYGIIIISVIFGLLLNFTGLDPIKALIYSAVLNGLVAPLILILIVDMGGNKKIMGSLASGRLAKTIGWLITIIMIVVGTAAIASLLI